MIAQTSERLGVILDLRQLEIDFQLRVRTDAMSKANECISLRLNVAVFRRNG